VRHFGSWSGAITAIFAAIILQRRDETAFTWHDRLFLLSMTMTIWSGTRAAILAIGVACAIQVVSTRSIPKIAVIGRLSILTGMAACIAFPLIPFGDSNFYLFSISDGYQSAGEISSGRTDMWLATYHKWLEAPWFGWGSGSTFWEVRALGWTHTQPHNFLLQFLVSWGVVGTTGAIWLLGRTLFAAHRSTSAQPALYPLLIGADALLVMACLEGMLHYPRFIMLLMLLFAAIFKLAHENAEA
jgi:O-antigen ligase